MILITHNARIRVLQLITKEKMKGRRGKVSRRTCLGNIKEWTELNVQAGFRMAEGKDEYSIVISNPL